MGFNRPEAKLRAKAAMRGAYPHPMLVRLVFWLVTGLLTGVIMMFVSNPISMFYAYLLQGNYDPYTVMQYVFTPARTGVFVVLQIILSLYLFVMNFGYTSYALRLARGEQPGYRNLLDGFALAGRVILTGILISVFTFLWGMLAMVPYFVVMVVAVLLQSPVLMALGILLLFAGMIVEIAVTYRYRLAFYFLLDNPGMGALEAVTQSKLAMKGWKGDLFVLDWSFFWWLLLDMLTLGILGLWLSPYMAATEANFYDWVVHGSFSLNPPGGNPGGYPGPGNNNTYNNGGPNNPPPPSNGPEVPF